MTIELVRKPATASNNGELDLSISPQVISGTKQFYVGGVLSGEIGNLGVWTLGQTGGLGTNYHTVYGSILGRVTSGSGSYSLFSPTTLDLNANAYRSDTGVVKAHSTVTGYTNLTVTRTTSSSGLVFELYSNYQDAQTAGSNVVTTNQISVATATAAAAWTLGGSTTASSFSLHTLNGGFNVNHSGSNAAAFLCSIQTTGGLNPTCLDLRNATGSNISGAVFLTMRNAAGTVIGSISAATNTTVSYNNPSDIRLKENVSDFVGALSLVESIRPVKFTWKGGGEQEDRGFIAQELKEAYPFAVTSPKNETDYYQVDYSKLTPLLTAAIKELKQQLDETKQELADYIASHP
jgi:hypothetical protein